MSTKQEIMDEICEFLGIPKMKLSTGSTEPKEFLLLVADQMGLIGIAAGEDKINIGKTIVEASGTLWLPEYESAGATITKEGLLAIQRSIESVVK